MKKKRSKKRRKLLALFSAVSVLLAGGAGAGIAFSAMAAVKKSTSSSSLSSPSSLSNFKELYFKAEGEDGENLKEVKFLLTSPSSSKASLSSLPPSSSSFEFPKGSSVSYSKRGDSIDLPQGENGVFSFEAKPGKYDITMQGGESEEGKNLTYGSYYFAPSFEADLTKDGETLTSLSDPFGFVNPKEKEVIVGAQNPSSERVEGNKLSSSPFASLPGSSHPYSYQIESFLPFVQTGVNAKGNRASLIPLTFSLSLQNQTLVKKSIEVNSIPLSSLMGSSLSSSSSSSVKLALSPLALKTIEEKGKSPLPASSLLTQEGNTDRQLSITFEAYLNPASKGSSSKASTKAPSKTSSSPSTFEFDYQAWMGKEPKGKEEMMEPKVTVDTPVIEKRQSSDKTPARSVLTSSSYQGLPCVGEDGKPLKQVTVLLANAASGGDGDSIPYVFTNSNANIPSGDIGLPVGSTVTASYQGDTVTFEGSDITIFNPSAFPVQLTPISGVNQEGASVSYGSDYVSPQLYLSFTSSGVSATVQVWSPFLDYSSQGNVTQIVVGATNPAISRVDGSSLSSSAFTATVGSSNPYTYQATAFLPYGYGDDDINSGNSFLPSDPLTFTLYTPGQSLDLTSFKVNGLSFLSLFEAGGIMYSMSGNTFTLQFYPTGISMINSEGSLPFPSSGSLTQNGITNHTLSIEWNAYLNPSFTSSSDATFAFYYEDLVGNQGQGETSGSAMPVTPEVSTNGPADNSVPSSLSPQDPSSSTGLWFKALWKSKNTPATGSKFSVQNSKGLYLSPEESNGSFEGWEFSSSPFDFEGQNTNAVFSFGGLADGTYTITQQDPPAGAPSSSLSFTSTLSYSSPEVLKALNDSMGILDPSLDTLYYGLNAPSISSLPLTGGKGLLFISLSSFSLLVLGAGIWWSIKKRGGSGRSSFGKHA
ncbi:MAG: hypothetical protein J6S17_00270 [Aeriscardovia sp.]|nr:hypothetical protein [Aeriscardovia sp.]